MWIGIIILLVILTILAIIVIIKRIIQKRIEAEIRKTEKQQHNLVIKYCCDTKMRLIMHDCQYSDGGIKRYFVCYTCQNQVGHEFEEACKEGYGGKYDTQSTFVDPIDALAASINARGGQRW